MDTRRTHTSEIGYPESDLTWPWPRVTFEDNGLVSPMMWVWSLPLVGGILAVPPGTRAVLIPSHGNHMEFSEGRHTLANLDSGRWPVYYVNVKQQRTPVSLTQAWCLDGWQAELAVDVSWRVGSAARIVDVVDPRGALVSAVKAIIRAEIESRRHDDLISGFAKQTLNDDVIARSILHRLRGHLAHQGLYVHQVLVTERRGDERRVKIVQEKTVERTEMAEQHRLALQRISNEAATITERMALEQERRELTLFEAESKRKQTEEESKVRIREAEIEAEVAARLLPARRQELQLELMAETQRQQHELTVKKIEAYDHILSEAAKATPELWGVSSRRRPEYSFGERDAMLSQGLAKLQTLRPQPDLDLVPEETLPSAADETLLDHLWHEVTELNRVDGMRAWLGPHDAGGYKIKVHGPDIKLDIICQPGYPFERPIVLASDNGYEPVELTIPWAGSMSLKDIALVIHDHLACAPQG